MASQAMNKKIINICGLIAGVITGSTALLCINTIFHSQFYIHIDLSSHGIHGYSSHTPETSICVSLFIGIIGFIAGRAGAKSRSVKHAFWTGAAGFFLAMTISMSLLMIKLNLLSPINHSDVYQGIFWITTSTCTGSLACGLAAIMARDYIRFQRIRLIPQFTIVELLSIVTLFAIILGSLMCLIRSF
jgi:hypothetical protein